MPYPGAMSSPLYEEYWVLLRNIRLFLRGRLNATLELYGIFFFTFAA